ncbi:hypothetical protein T484DRAFT_1783717 [Baffinella frigidus]|nr:hypothetical protein T484DRAFT_1783717 [Cryptophyta sp. CCMP2293]
MHCDSQFLSSKNYLFKVADPSEGSPAFSRDPSQRNSPQLATSGISLTSSSTSSTTGSDAQPSPTHPPPSETPIQPPPSPPKPTIRVGIVGTGTICEVVVTGLCLENAGDLVITISPRNAARAAALAAKFPDQVRIGKDNQDVVDSSDIVCIAVVPTLAEEVLAALEFRADHTVVGFMSTTRLDVIRKHAAPATKVLRAVPMPPFARRVGAIPMHPPDEAVAALFSRAGTTVEVATEDEVITLMSVTGMMAPFYASLSAAQKWAAKQGVEETASSRFVGALFHSLADNCKAQGNGFDHIVAESQTPGGLNEQALRELKASGVYTLLEAEMDVILARVQGKPRPEQIGPPREQ